MGETILVAGATGFIGTHLSRRLLTAGHRVIALSHRRPEAAVHRWIPAGHLLPDPTLAEAGTILWAAGASTPASTVASPQLELDDNLRPLIALLESMQAGPPKRLLYLSTGGAIYGDVSLGLANERSVVEPKSYYSAGKAAAEAFLAACAHQTGHEVTILRPSNVYGPGQAYRQSFGIVPTSFRAIRTGEPVVIRGNGDAVRDYLHVSDLADLVELVITQQFKAGARTFNASSGQGTSLNALFSLIESAIGYHVPRIYEPAPSFDVGRIVLDNTLARKTFGWKPKVPLIEGLAEAWSNFD